jgi:hypothetical protein
MNHVPGSVRLVFSTPVGSRAWRVQALRAYELPLCFTICQAIPVPVYWRCTFRRGRVINSVPGQAWNWVASASVWHERWCELCVRHPLILKKSLFSAHSFEFLIVLYCFRLEYGFSSPCGVSSSFRKPLVDICIILRIQTLCFLVSYSLKFAVH